MRYTVYGYLMTPKIHEQAQEKVSELMEVFSKFAHLGGR
jgi:hypothetical protein